MRKSYPDDIYVYSACYSCKYAAHAKVKYISVQKPYMAGDQAGLRCFLMERL